MIYEKQIKRTKYHDSVESLHLLKSFSHIEISCGLLIGSFNIIPKHYGKGDTDNK